MRPSRPHTQDTCGGKDRVETSKAKQLRKKSSWTVDIGKTIKRRPRLFTLAAVIGAGIATPYAGLAVNAGIQDEYYPMFVWGVIALALLVGMPIGLFLLMRKEQAC